MDVALGGCAPRILSRFWRLSGKAFLPLRLGTAFKRELNNRYARYLVAVQPPVAENLVEEGSAADIPAAVEPDGAADATLWGRMVRGVKEMALRRPAGEEPAADIAGYVGLWFQGNEAHITEIAVRERLRGNGIGELLLIGSVRAALENGSAVLTLEARVSNFIAQRLYEKYGFQEVGLRKNYYSDNRGGCGDNDHQPHPQQRVSGVVQSAAREVSGAVGGDTEYGGVKRRLPGNDDAAVVAVSPETAKI